MRLSTKKMKSFGTDVLVYGISILAVVAAAMTPRQTLSRRGSGFFGWIVRWYMLLTGFTVPFLLVYGLFAYFVGWGK